MSAPDNFPQIMHNAKKKKGCNSFHYRCKFFESQRKKFWE